MAADQATKAIKGYFSEIHKNLLRGNATEHTHRSVSKALIESFKSGMVATNEPKHVDCGTHDFVLTRKASTVGYVEAKDVRASVDEAEREMAVQAFREIPELRNLISAD